MLAPVLGMWGHMIDSGMRRDRGNSLGEGGWAEVKNVQ